MGSMTGVFPGSLGTDDQAVKHPGWASVKSAAVRTENLACKKPSDETPPKESHPGPGVAGRDARSGRWLVW
jgi:hypothetical protein